MCGETARLSWGEVRERQFPPIPVQRLQRISRSIRKFFRSLARLRRRFVDARIFDEPDKLSAVHTRRKPRFADELGHVGGGKKGPANPDQPIDFLSTQDWNESASADGVPEFL